MCAAPLILSLDSASVTHARSLPELHGDLQEDDGQRGDPVAEARSNSLLLLAPAAATSAAVLLAFTLGWLRLLGEC